MKIACQAQVVFRLADLAWMNGQKQILDAVAVGGSCGCSVGAALCMAHLQLGTQDNGGVAIDRSRAVCQ